SKKSDAEALLKVKEELKKEGFPEESNEEEKSKEKINNLPLIIYSAVTILFFIFSGFGFENPINILTNFNLFWFDITFDLFFILAVIFFATAVYEFLRKRPEHPFRDKRFTYFIFILIPVQTLFAHNWLTIPYYPDRAYAGTLV